MVLAFDPVDAVCWPRTQGRYIQAVEQTFNYTVTGKVWSKKSYLIYKIGLGVTIRFCSLYTCLQVKVKVKVW